MRKVMRIWVACVALALMISSTSLAASDAITLNMVKTQVAAGEVVDGSIDVQADGVTNGMLTITYDTRLELVSAEKNADQGEDIYVSINSKNAGKLVIAFAGKSAAKQGALVNLKFKVAENAAAKDQYDVAMSDAEVYDQKDEALSAGDKSQTLTIAGGSSTEDPGKDSEKDPDKDSGKDADKDSDKNKDKDKNKYQGTDSSNKGDKSNVKTGDTQNLALYMVMMLVGAAGIITVVVWKGKAGGRNGRK